MSLQIDLLHPELGFFDDNHDLTDPRTYDDACRPFGTATALPPLAYRSKAFLELENEKIWTREWVAIGVSPQIPNPGDLLPFTTGFHGVHVQRGCDNGLSARFNFHQHGGCRFVPEQCRTGKQTKCPISSCNYTRDADAIPALEYGENSPEMYKFVGINPNKLKSVRSGCLGPVVFVNVDPGAMDFNGDANVVLQQFLDGSLILAAHDWLDFKCNWKLLGAEFIGTGRSVRPHQDGQVPTAVEAMADVRDMSEFMTTSELGDTLRLFWLFPNLLVAVAPAHIVTVVMQATGMSDTLCRVSVLLPKEGAESAALDPVEYWPLALRGIGASAEKTQRRMAEWGTSRQPDKVGFELMTETNFARYVSNQYVLSKVLTEHELHWHAPIMDARMMQRRGSR